MKFEYNTLHCKFLMHARCVDPQRTKALSFSLSDWRMLVLVGVIYLVSQCVRCWILFII